MRAWVRPGPLSVPLVTTGSILDTHPGALGQPGTQVLFGNNPLNFPSNSGVSGQVGLFLDSQSRFSIDAGGFYLPPNAVRYSVSSDNNGNPLIATPLFFVAGPTAADIPHEGSLIDSFPGFLAGGASVIATSKLYGGEVNGRYHFYAGRLHGSALFGFRSLRLDESLTLADAIAPLVPGAINFLGSPVNPPDALSIQDQFRTSNTFYGLQVGSQLAWEEDWWYVSLLGKIAVGGDDQKMDINGSTSVYDPIAGQIASTSGGYLTQPSNIGNRQRSEFSILPEVGVNVGLEPIRHFRILLGYTALMLTNVVRPGTMIDRSVNSFTVPVGPYGMGTGPAAPTFVFHDQLFWMQAFTVGLQFYY